MRPLAPEETLDETAVDAAEPRLSPLVARLVAILWAAVGWFPWQGVLPSPWARTALAIAWFVLPGIHFAELVRRRRLELPGSIALGFALSLALACVLGLLACIVGVSFVWIALGFSVIGGYFVQLRLRVALPGDGWRRPLPDQVALALGLALVALGGRLAFDPGVGSADDLTGFARTTWFRYADWLDFGEPLFTTGERIAPRYWIAYWPLAKALLSFAANVDPLPFTTLYLPPFLLALGLLATWSLARSAGASRPGASLAVGLQLACCAWLASDPGLPGFVLWRRITQDKVAAAAILTPLFLGGAVRLLRARDRTAWITTALVGLALLLTHGEALGLTGLYVGALVVFGTLSTGRWRAGLGILGLTALLASPALALRFVDHPMNDRIRAYAEALPSGELRDAQPEASPFYGLRTERVLHAPYALIALAALASLRRRRSAVEDLALAAAVVLGFVVVPYTGWILGRIVTPPHLARVPWFCPFGVAALAVWVRATGFFGRAGTRAAWLELASVPLALVAVGWPLRDVPATLARGLRPPFGWERQLGSWRPIDLVTTYDDLAHAGAFLDEEDELVRVCGDRLTNDLLPAVSTRARLFFYRAPIQTVIHGNVSHAEANVRQKDWHAIVGAPGTPLAERARLLRTRGIRYVVLSESTPWSVELVEEDPGIDAVFHAGRLVVLGVELREEPQLDDD